MIETAFAVNVPEAESTVSRLREQHDPSAALGVPAHITILYPFMAPAEISRDVLDRIRYALRHCRPFAFSVDQVARLPKVLYLAPDPPEPFAELTTALVAGIPGYLPYRGIHARIIPHLTVAQGEEEVLDELEIQLRGSLSRDGLHAMCRQLTLIENSSGRWRDMHTFDLEDGTSGSTN